MMFRKIVLMVVGLSALTACADGRSLSDRLAGSSRVSGDAETVQVYETGSRAEALPFAGGHCAHFGRSAEYSSVEAKVYTFRCVKT